MTTPSDDHILRLRDAARRLELNLHEIHGVRPRLILGKMRGPPVMRQALYENYLSSVYSAKEIVTALCNKYNWDDFKKRIQDASNADEVLKYVHYSRNAQDHGISPVATRAATDPVANPVLIMGFGFFGMPMAPPPGQINREEFSLSPITLREKKGKITVIPVPTKHMGLDIFNVTPELLAELSASWWFSVINSIVFKDFSFPPAVAPVSSSTAPPTASNSGP